MLTADKTPDATLDGAEVSTHARSLDVPLSRREKTLSGLRVVRGVKEVFNYVFPL